LIGDTTYYYKSIFATEVIFYQSSLQVEQNVYYLIKVMRKFCAPAKKKAGTCRLAVCMLLMLLCANLDLAAQDQSTTGVQKDSLAAVAQNDTVATVDLTDILRKIFKKKQDSTQKKKSKGIALLPTFGYNPSLGFQIGGKVSAEKQFGDPSNTKSSLIGLIAVYTSKGIINLQAIHNVFTPGNKMNWQGNQQLSFYQVTDYGIGPGKGYPDSADVIKFNYIRFYEKAYVKIAEHFFLGGGLNFNIRRAIDDKNQSSTYNTANENYSAENGLDPHANSANGILAAFQYNTRENPIQSYGGIYADMSLQLNQKWLGSSKSAFQFIYDFRKYVGLSKKNPATVLAFWSLGSFKLAGTLPYLELPYTGMDAYNRSGRGYTISRFKGPSYFYFETEYRFPIMRNRLISGVCFINTETASNTDNKELFGSWGTAAGAGLRVLFQKQSRTTICFDYAIGQYGSRGFFIGLNEAF
jgi:hypothetical protein